MNLTPMLVEVLTFLTNCGVQLVSTADVYPPWPILRLRAGMVWKVVLWAGKVYSVERLIMKHDVINAMRFKNNARFFSPAGGWAWKDDSRLSGKMACDMFHAGWRKALILLTQMLLLRQCLISLIVRRLSRKPQANGMVILRFFSAWWLLWLILVIIKYQISSCGWPSKDILRAYKWRGILMVCLIIFLWMLGLHLALIAATKLVFRGALH